MKEFEIENEAPLYDYGGYVDKNVGFEIAPDESGIILNQFDFEGETFQVLERTEYEPWNAGLVNPGAGQVGIYEVKDEEGNEYTAEIKDYRAAEGDWRIFLRELE